MPKLSCTVTGSDNRIQQTLSSESSKLPNASSFSLKAARKDYAKGDGGSKMATSFLPTANPLFLPCSSSSSSSSSLSPAAVNPHKNHLKSKITSCRAFSDAPIATVRRRGLAISFLTTSFLFSLEGRERRGGANAAILEADDDVELLEKVKKDRKKRLERQGIINSSKTEKGLVFSHFQNSAVFPRKSDGSALIEIDPVMLSVF